MTLLRTAATDASDARALATASAEQAELVRAQWTAAAQRTKGMERLASGTRRRCSTPRTPPRSAPSTTSSPAAPGARTRRRGGAVDGVTQVQARISEIQSRFLVPRARDLRRLGSAAAAAGLDGHATPTSGQLRRRPRRRAPSSPRRRSTSACPTSGAAPTRRRGLDCSGFTQLVYGNLGCRPAPDLLAAGQRRRGASRPSTTPRPGDLMFFDHSSSRGRGFDPTSAIYVGNWQDDRGAAGRRVGQRLQDVGTPTIIRSGSCPTADDDGGVHRRGRPSPEFPTPDLFTRAAGRYGVNPAWYWPP
jgi:cell wall-associated NlpC family hydrolase